MAVIMKGKRLVDEMEIGQRNAARAFKDQYGRAPKLAVVVAGNNAASEVYVRNKLRACERVGVDVKKIELEDTVTEDNLYWVIRDLNRDDSVDGIIVQLPLPYGIDADKVAQFIDPQKDVDCFTDANRGKLFTGCDELSPCTPEGILCLLEAYVEEWQLEKLNHVVILGRSNIVGKPLANMLMTRYDTTVTVCNSHTQNLKELTKMADVLIVAIGKAKYVTKDMVKEGAVVIDVGINRLDDGTLCGDVNFEAVKDVAGYITPVPGGVGKMTVACLIDNVINAAFWRK